ncbi:hypothetical protein HK099_000904 [Clydaea vesicula]|uniref:PH domain-containing protein n=1 Tax=Clydaea vesicula TaxID=447962 RepID=A0AAD5U706_9FUNG|nr:hypothetical protein HK099_000904 [Clydaea vesicula]
MAVSKRNIIKQGFIFKRGGSSILSHWKQKFLVLSTSFDAEKNKFNTLLTVYDKRDQLLPPKNEINFSECSVILETKSMDKKINIGPKNNKYFFALTVNGVNKKKVIGNDLRLFLFSTASRSDCEEWIRVLEKCLPKENCYNVQNQRDLINSNNKGLQKVHNLSNSSYTLPRSRSNTNQDYNSDAVSTYSDDSCFTNSDRRSMRSRSCSEINADASPINCERKSLYSAIETMSFCSEPVLTFEELNEMGVRNSNYLHNQIAKSESNKKKGITKGYDSLIHSLIGKQTAFHTEINGSDNWHQKFQKILSIKLENEEMILKRDIMMVEVAGNFKEKAVEQAQKIIDNLHMAQSCKKVFSFPRGVWAGTFNGISYQFIANYDDSTPEQITYAEIRTSQELLGLNSIISTNSGLSVELIINVDYKGFRIVCVPEVYESLNLMQDLIKEHPIILDEANFEKILYSGKILNLKPHFVMLKDNRRVLVPLSTGIQAVKSSSNVESHIALKRMYETFPLDYCNVEDSKQKTTPLLFSKRPSPVRRLRPEFVRSYPHQLCSDALTEWCAHEKHDRDQNDLEVVRAGRFLQEVWIPSFVKKLDELEIRPIDSRTLGLEMHRAGVNVRYLGLIYRLSKIPFIKDMCAIEMIARAFKGIFKCKIRTALLNFRSVGATSIEDQMKEYPVSMFNWLLGKGSKSEKCGVLFDDNVNYTFDNQDNGYNPLNKKDFLSFDVKVKQIGGNSTQTPINEETMNSIISPPEEILAYYLSRHFKSLGKNSKLQKNEDSAQSLTEISSFYNSTGRHEEAKAYANSALGAARKDTCLHSFALAQIIETQCGLQTNSLTIPDASILQLYKKSLQTAEYHWGTSHPLLMGLHDRLSAVFLKANLPKQALEYHLLSLDICFKSLGKNHIVTAGILLSLNNETEQAIKKFNEARHIYQALDADRTLISEVYFHLASALAARGDLDGAILNAKQSKKFREQSLGQYEVRTVETYQLLANLLLANYHNYTGVLTPQIKVNYTEAISCLEKIFRFVKNNKNGRNSRSGFGTSGRNTPSISGRSTPVRPKTHNRSQSLVSQISAKNSNTLNNRFLSGGGTSAHIGGPFFTAPFSPTPTFEKNLIHRLTKKIVKLKLDLIENKQHQEKIRILRQKIKELKARNAAEFIDDANYDDDDVNSPFHNFTAEEAKDVIIKLAAVSPSIYLDGILMRIEEEDETALSEMMIVLQLTESDTVGLN